MFASSASYTAHVAGRTAEYGVRIEEPLKFDMIAGVEQSFGREGETRAGRYFFDHPAFEYDVFPTTRIAAAKRPGHCGARP
jgi:hypothetical protein